MLLPPDIPGSLCISLPRTARLWKWAQMQVQCPPLPPHHVAFRERGARSPRRRLRREEPLVFGAESALRFVCLAVSVRCGRGLWGLGLAPWPLEDCQPTAAAHLVVQAPLAYVSAPSALRVLGAWAACPMLSSVWQVQDFLQF